MKFSSILFLCIFLIISSLLGQNQQNDAAKNLAEVKRIEENYQKIRAIIVRQYQMDDSEAIDKLFSDDPALYTYARSCLIRFGPSYKIRQNLSRTIECSEEKRQQVNELLALMNTLRSSDLNHIKHVLQEAISTQNKDVLFLCLWGQSDEIAGKAVSEFKNIGDATDVPALLLAFYAHSGAPLGGTEQEYYRIRLHQEYRAALQRLTGLSLPEIEWKSAFNSPEQNEFDYDEIFDKVSQWCEKNWAKIQRAPGVNAVK